MNYFHLQNQDPDVFNIVLSEIKRQKEGIELIPSENYCSKAVLETMGTILTDKYAEGYPKKRYYGGNINIDEIELLCEQRAKEVFEAFDYDVNVQAYSGTPANLAVYLGVLEKGDTILSLKLESGGHLSHGSPVNLSGKLFNFVHYEINPKTGFLDYDLINDLAKKHKPKLIISGFTAYPRQIDFKKISEISKSIGAISMADISHISGLVIGGLRPSPFPCCDIITTTTHKTLRGPRGALIFSKKEFSEKINKAVFPGIQGGPHEHIIAAIAVALKEAQTKDFKDYAKQIILNAQVLAKSLINEGINLVSGGTDNHLLLVDLRNFGGGLGYFIEKALEAVNITVNKNPIPQDDFPPYYPSGIRLGTPAVTSRGMKEDDLVKIGKWIAKIIKEFSYLKMPQNKDERDQKIKEFQEIIKNNKNLEDLKEEVKEFAQKFPLPGVDI
jgi:glycine hydroxymethyltransferase